VNEKGGYSDLVISQVLRASPLNRLDRSLVTELVNGTIKRRLTLDWVLGQYLKKGVEHTPSWARDILRLAAYQLLYLDRVPAAAVCDTAVELAKKYAPPTAGMVNGVLRNLCRSGFPELPPCGHDPVLYLALKHSHPPWLVKRWLARWGREQTEAFLAANNQRPPLCIRVNTLKTQTSQVAAELQSLGAKVYSSRWVPEGLVVEGLAFLERLPGIKAGRFLFQDEGSMLVGYCVSPPPDSTVLDACAGVGTKTTHLAQLMGNQGEIVAVDLKAGKLRLLEKSCRRLGIGIVRTLVADSTSLASVLDHKFDCVLVDAPCSGLGVLRRRADARWRKRPEDLEFLPVLQLKLLEAAQELVRAGGTLVYSTCTVEPEENEGVVEELCRRHPYWEFEDLRPYLPVPLARPEDQEMAAHGRLQLYPHLHGTDGFFVARLRRKE
jgi:16S rRNA (cytosine967-C5)-methyltransferase